MRRLTTVRNSVEATLLQQALDLEGVNSFLTNEHTATLFPHWYGLLGHGIQLMVSDDDYEKAKDILARREKELQVRSCPNCGSTAIGFGIRGKKRLVERLFVLVSLIFFIMPMGHIKNKHYCKDCGADFE